MKRSQLLLSTLCLLTLSLATAIADHPMPGARPGVTPGGDFGVGFGALGAIQGLEQTTSVLESTVLEIEGRDRLIARRRLASIVARLRRVEIQLVDIDPGFSRGAWYQATGQECVSFCRSIALESTLSREGAQCVSGESQASSALGRIVYTYGTWGGAADGPARSSLGYCYRPGQKRDNDRTDITVGCFCGR